MLVHFLSYPLGPGSAPDEEQRRTNGEIRTSPHLSRVARHRLLHVAVFVARSNIRSIRHMLYVQYVGDTLTFNQFNELLDRLKDEPYTWLVFANNAGSNLITERVFFYKASFLTPHLKFPYNIALSPQLRHSTQLYEYIIEDVDDETPNCKRVKK